MTTQQPTRWRLLGLGWWHGWFKENTIRKPLVAVLGLCMTCLTTSAYAQVIEAGSDHYRTAVESAWVEIGGTSGIPQIEEGFFGPGSDPFDGVVAMESHPMPGFPGQVDTIVERTADADMTGGSDTVELELIALNLVSVDPIVVTYDGGTGHVDSFFDVYMHVVPPPDPPSTGSMTITEDADGGGGQYTMYAADGDGINYYIEFTFVEVEPPTREVAAPLTWQPPTNPHQLTTAYPGLYQYAEPATTCDPGTGYYLVPGDFVMVDIDGGGSGGAGLIPCARGWMPGDPHKMHFPQLPDEQGWDVNATSPLVLADDWTCSETGWVKDIHLWGSWRDMDHDGHGDVGNILWFNLSIHSNIPDPDPNDPTTWSMPGPMMWGQEIWDFDMVPIDPPTWEAWLDPPYDPAMSFPNDHDAYFQYNIYLPEHLWFWQDAGATYWLDVSAVLDDPFNYQWGWKSTIDHYLDDAVWWDSFADPPGWYPLIEPPRENWFDVTVDSAGSVVAGSGTNAYTTVDEEQWFYYPEYGWWNIWFYDNPFTYDNYKSGWLWFWVVPVDPELASNIRVAVNWSTDAWSLEGEPGRPPLPSDFAAGGNEDDYIGRSDLVPTTTIPADGLDIYEWFEITGYNPEWISVDVQGSNFMIVPAFGGIISHECVTTSMDLAFVITPGPLGACCYPEPGGWLSQCVDGVTEGQCITVYNGVWQGDYSVCWGMEACCLQDNSCVYADALCCMNELNGTPAGPGSSCTPGGWEACCLPDNTCVMADPVCCTNVLGGIPEGPLTQCGGMEACCLPDNSCVMADALCCAWELGGVPQGPTSLCVGDMRACCLPDDSCVMADPLCCVNELNGTPRPAGSQCTQIEACCIPNPLVPGFYCQDLDPECCLKKNGIPQGAGQFCSGVTVACCLQDGSGQCFNVEPLCCDEMGGIPSAWSQACLGDGNGNGTDDACEPQPTGACCFDDGHCEDLTQTDCEVNPDGDYKGDGTRCFGDMNGNGIDDACEIPWQPGDQHKMHFPQLPDETGWDVYATEPMVLADDWTCSQSGWITDFHFWGSWRNDIVGKIDYFIMSVHENIPENPPDIPWSRPGTVIWEEPIHNFVVTPIDPLTLEGWYDPAQGLVLPGNHQRYFQYDVYLPEELIWQDAGTIYWLNISAVLDPTGPEGAQWGWKSSLDHHEDDAVWAYLGEYNWIEIYEPYGPVRDDFFICLNETGGFFMGGGSGYNGGEWFYYPNFEPGWWNQWFYDHPFYLNRWKQGLVQMVVWPYSPALDSMFTFALNYSTPEWSLEGNPPGAPRVPPLPPLTPAEEEMYIGRDVLVPAQPVPPDGLVINEPFILDLFNPEWISADVSGWNFCVEMGFIDHDCLGSLDLAFVVTGGEPIGACCYDDTNRLCDEMTQTNCDNLSGTYMGDGTSCEGIEACCMPWNPPGSDCMDADALCCREVIGGVPQGPLTACTATEACCMPDGTCENVDPLCCDERGGIPAGTGTSCVGDITGCCLNGGVCENHEHVCCINVMHGAPQTQLCTGTTEACCIDIAVDPDCIDIDPLCCDDEGGHPSPIGAPACMGDTNGNGQDDACETPQACCLPDASCVNANHADCVHLGGDPQGPETACPPVGDVVCHLIKWAQPPTFSPISPQPECFWGWDEPSIYGGDSIVADDFLCEEMTPISDIHWWGSYLGYFYPEPPAAGDGPRLFHIGIWTDVPAGVDQSWSHPGMMIREWVVERDTLNERAVGCDLYPGMGMPDTCFRYDFIIPENEWFWQEGGPTVYWISIAAWYPIGERSDLLQWGWKTRRPEWNDDAVRIFQPTMPTPGWVFEVGEPIENFEGSWDMAFVLTTNVAPPKIPDGEVGYDKIRYISFEPGNPGIQTALRVTLTTMPPPYAGFSGQKMWVDGPMTKCENAGVIDPPCPPVPGLPPDFQSARLRCDKLCMDWGTVGALHVCDDEIVPLGVYDVQAINCSADDTNEANYSDPLTINTSKWGDLISDCTVIPCGPPDGIVNVTTDVTSVLDKYKNLPFAVMKSRADLDWNQPDWLINISDVTFCLDAFLGFTYPPTGWAGPGGCP